MKRLKIQFQLGMASLLMAAAAVPQSVAQSSLRAETTPSVTFDQLIDLGKDDLNDFWNQQFVREGWSYDAPAMLYHYYESIHTACGTARLNNAFYCGNNHSIYYDAGFLSKIFASARFGDFGTLTILAHEWAHAVQYQLPTNLRPAYNMALELQADCFAGAYAQFLDDRLSTRLVLEEGDLEEGATFLYSIGDDLAWFDPEAHGSPYDRSLHFVIGQSEGIDGCLPPYLHEDPDGAFVIPYPRKWRVQQDDQWSQDGKTYFKSFMMTPPHAEQAVLHGYMSEGIRLNFEMPRRGYEWTVEHRATWASEQMQRVLAANPGFSITDSTAVNWLSGRGMQYWIEGTSSSISEPEKTSIIVVTDPRFLMLAELASPSSQYDYYTHRLTQLVKGLHMLNPQAPR